MSTLINTDYLTGQVNSINAATGCEELGKIVASVFKSVNEEKAAIEDQLLQYTPMLVLLELPKTPDEVAKWIENLITHFITPQIKPAIAYTTQLAEIATSITVLTSAIENAISKLSCSIEIPTGI